jgi:antitoxin component YwqK of YwqJK toxin-antitoxin module
MKHNLLTLIAALLLCTALHAQDKKRWTVTFHPNETIASEGYLINKKKSGKWKYYDPSGKLTHYITYKNDLRSGWEMYYLPDMDTLRLVYNRNDVPDSTYKEWDIEGRLITSGFYKNGKRDSTWNFWKAIPSTGQTFVWVVPTFTIAVPPVKGQKSKPAPKYVDPGRLVKTATYKNDELDGPYAEYDVTTAQQLISGIYKAGKKNGPFIEASKDRNSYTENTYRNDTLVKVAELWDVSGRQRKKEYELRDGVKNGSYREWYDYSTVEKLTGSYRNGLREGLFTEFNNAGKKKLTYTYVAGVLQGERCDYDAKGNIETRGYLKNSMYDSTFTEYYETGEKAWEGRCRNGLFEGDFTAYYKNGIAKEKGFYSNDVREGTVYGFTTDGRKLYSAGYKSGMLHGLYLEYHDNGNVFISQQFLNDTFAGAPTFFNEKGKPIVYIAQKSTTSELLHVNELPEVVIRAYRVTLYYGSGYAPASPPVKPDLLANLRKRANDVLEMNRQRATALPGEEYIEVSETAEYPGGTESFRQYLQKNIRYPEMEREMGIEGNLYMKITIDKTGAVSVIEPLREIPGGIGITKEVTRVLKAMPAMKPAKKNGRAVDDEFTIRFKFVLE